MTILTPKHLSSSQSAQNSLNNCIPRVYSSYPTSKKFIASDFIRQQNSLVQNKNSDSAKSVLGTITKSASNLATQGLGDDLVIVRTKVQRRIERFLLQEEACKLLMNERVNYCLKHRITKEKGVVVKYNKTTETASYSNLQTCGSVWNCPICAAKISEKRRTELKLGIARHRKNGGYVYLLTLTNSHHHGDNLEQLMAGQKKAIKYLWSDRKSKEHFSELGKVGHITANEVTHGKNGWHPHMHILLFFDKAVDIKELQTFIAKYWQHCCKKSKLKEPSIDYGCDITDGSFADRYVAKWGIEEEMTKGHIKQGREGGNTPFDLLKLSELGCERSGRLFQEYAAAYKGKRQLSWSSRLKALLLVEDVTDKEVAEKDDDDSIEERELALEIWHLIVVYKERGKALRAIELDKTDNENRFNTLIEDLAKRYVIDYPEKLIRDAEIIAVRAELLKHLT